VHMSDSDEIGKSNRSESMKKDDGCRCTNPGESVVENLIPRAFHNEDS
jgi:hypothetical protein